MTDEMKLLLEAFAIEAGERVAQVTRDVGRLQRTPGDSAGWRAVAASLRLVADSAVMMELPEVEWLARRGHEAALAMADQAGWQRPELAQPLGGLVTALERLLAGLPTPGFDPEPARADGEAAFHAWERLTAESVPTTDSTEASDLASIVAATADDAMPAWIAAGPPPEELGPPPWEAAASTPWEEPTQPAWSDDRDAPARSADEISPDLAETGADALAVADVAPLTGPLARLASWRKAFAHQGAPSSNNELGDNASAADAAPETWDLSVGVDGPSSLAETDLMLAGPSWLAATAELPAVEIDAAPDDEIVDLKPFAPVSDDDEPAEMAGATEHADSPTEIERAEDVSDTDESGADDPVGASIDGDLTATAADATAIADAVDEPPSPDEAALDDAADAAPAIDSDLLEVFNEEVGEHLAALDSYLLVLADNPRDLAALTEARRSLHTLKGAAGMVGLTPVHALGRVSEETVEQFLDTGAAVPTELLEAIQATVEVLHGAMEASFSAESLTACAVVTEFWHGLEFPVEPGDAGIAEPTPASATDDPTAEQPIETMFAVEPTASPAPAGAIEGETIPPAVEIDAPLPDRVDAAEPTSVADPSHEDADPIAGEAVADEVDILAGTDDWLTAEPAMEGDAEPIDGADDSQLAALFAVEVGDGLREIHDLLAHLTEPAGESEPEAHTAQRQATLHEILRQAHTLKGAAAMMGRQTFATLVHRMEDALERLIDGSMPVTPALIGLLFDTAEALEAMARPGGEHFVEPARALAIRYTAALGAAAAVRLGPALASQPARPTALGAAPSVRIDLDELGGLMGMAEELITHRASFQDRLGGLGGLLRDFERSVERLARVSRALEYDYEAWGVAGEQRIVEQDEFDTLELDRYTEFRRLTSEMVEAVADARTVGRDVSAALTGMNALVGRQGRVATALRKGLETISLVSLNGLAPMVRRVTSQTALVENKRVAVETGGLDLLVERSAHDVLNTALGHMIRNAIVHGIESAEARRAAGKEEVGRLTVDARQEHYETVVTVRDDGRGIDRHGVRRKAEELGWVDPDAAISDAELLGFIFRPGFSTAAALDEAAGRGVGLDAVLAAVTAARGRLTVESTPGEGSVFTVRLPLVMTVAEVLLVDSGGRRVALPMHWLEGTARVEMASLRPGLNGPEVQVGEDWLPALPLAELLGWPAELDSRPSWPAVIVAAGDRRAVLMVERLVQRHELAVASLGPSFTWLRSMVGASLLGDGRVAPVLDLPALLEMGRAATEMIESVARPPRVMVVDDSLSVRRVVAMALERQGWEAVQARNGQEALTLLASTPIDAMLLDVEMPQMDGYSLLERLRDGHEHTRLPVAMLTSRGSDKHRQRAMDLGADAYLVKPYQEQHLVETLRRLLEGAAVGARG